MKWLVLCIALLLAGCEDRICVRSHSYWRSTPVLVGKFPVVTISKQTQCDAYVPERADK